MSQEPKRTMRLAIRSLLVSLPMALSACSSLPWVVYDSPATVSSDRTAVITTSTGVVEGYNSSTAVMAAGVFIPIPATSAPTSVKFNDKDVAIFATSLERQLNRLGIVKAQRDETAAPQDIALRIYFDRTFKGPNNEYQLDVRLEIQTASSQTDKSYSVRSFVDENFLVRFNTTPKAGKRLAAERLMKAMIPDIEAVIRAEQESAPAVAAPSAAPSS